MKEIVIISGKGGTGKTSLAASFAILGSDDTVVSDCDVDASDLYLLLKPDNTSANDFYSGFKAEIDQTKCIACGRCKEICRFRAITSADNKFSIITLNCEGCSYCSRLCPASAIEMIEQRIGQIYISTTKTGNCMVHSQLDIGADNSGKLVAKLKEEAGKIARNTGKRFVLVDGPPGIGCPVTSSISGADLVVIVTEPTASGFHDLKRAYQLISIFKISTCCIINKADINQLITTKIMNFLENEKIIHLGNILYDEQFTTAMVKGKTIMEEGSSELKQLLTTFWKQIHLITEEEK